jgi:hypothetical protein
MSQLGLSSHAGLVIGAANTCRECLRVRLKRSFAGGQVRGKIRVKPGGIEVEVSVRRLLDGVSSRRGIPFGVSAFGFALVRHVGSDVDERLQALPPMMSFVTER